MTLQFMGLARNIMHLAGLDLYLYPYRVVATGQGVS